MSTRTSYKDNQFCWAELVSSDAEKSKKFYGALFDWEFEDNPVSETMVYTMAKYQGKYVCAMFTMNNEMKGQGVPSHWGQYISTSHLEDTVGKIEKCGGTIVTKPFDVFSAGRMAICQDPSGANFNLWQPKEHIGAQIVNEINCWGWSELTSWDMNKSKDFYSQVFGWNFEDLEGKNQYFVIKNGDEMNGGFLDAKAMGLDSHIPESWSTYFTVESIEETQKLAQENGGEVVCPQTKAEGVGTFIMVKDPQGAYVQFIELLEAPTD